MTDPQPTAADREAREIARAIVQDICELPDFNSPDDPPDLLLCTVDELTNIALIRVEAFTRRAQEREAELEVALREASAAIITQENDNVK